MYIMFVHNVVYYIQSVPGSQRANVREVIELGLS